MAKQKQDVGIEKTYNFDDLTFYKRGESYYVRRKSSLSGKKVKKSKVFERTIENSKEFSNASQFGGFLRLLLRELVVGLGGKHQNRLLALLYDFRHDDNNTIRGVRHVQAGLYSSENLQKLRGFGFDENNLLNDFGNKISGGGYKNKVLNFIPLLDLLPPIEATHFEFISIAAQAQLPILNFDLGKLSYLKNVVTSGKFPVNFFTPINIDLVHNLSIFQNNIGEWLYTDLQTRFEVFGFGVRFYANFGGGFIPVAQNKSISQITNVQLGNDLIVIDVINDFEKTVLHNLGHIPFVWLLDNTKQLSEALILHSSKNEFSVSVGVSTNFTICYYKRMGVEIPFSNQSEVIVSHNLGRYVAVQILDENGRVCGSKIVFNTLNSFTVDFGGVFSGTVVYYP